MIRISKPIIEEDEINAAVEVLKTGYLAQGKKVEEFEERFAEFIGVEHAVAVSSGTAALHIALLAHGIGEGDEVITTPFSFIATANSILLTGAKPVFADINENDFNINPDAVLNKITHRTKAIMPVHLYGHPADMKALVEIAEDHNLLIVEDACQAHGAEFGGKKVGSFGVGCFSFYATKNMTTGEGGMITTNDKIIAEYARMLRSHGSRQRYFHELLGFNMRMTDVSAAIGIVQLAKLPAMTRRRQENAEYLTNCIKNVEGVVPPSVKRGCTHVFHQYTIRVVNTEISRDAVVKELREKGIGAEIYYPIPIHKQPLYQDLGYDETLPVAERLAKEVISLPIHPAVSKEELKQCATALREVIYG
ncbi:MAG: aminotransferase DegT [Candidatus Alkanophagales archaeon]|nr:MAG: aminotransferase DegT [Candidatus Alkanophagales archaeon]